MVASPDACTLPPLAQPHSTRLNVGGIDVRVWGMERLTDAELTVMFFVHGCEGSKEQAERAARYIMPQMWRRKLSDPRAKDLLMVTFDARNHGSRMIDPTSNLPFDKNPRYAVDRYAIQKISHLITFLPSYLFPDSLSSRSPVSTWICAGASLGGHVTWLAGGKDPRITHLIPILSSPDYLALLSARAAASGLRLTPALWPRALDALVAVSDPVALPPSVWADKRVLAICGARDARVPPGAGGTAAFVARLRDPRWRDEMGGRPGRVEMRVDEAAGHEVTKAMLDWVCEWVWEEALLC